MLSATYDSDKACAICDGTTFLMYTVAGSKRTGARNEVLCPPCHKKWLAYEVELPVRKESSGEF